MNDNSKSKNPQSDTTEVPTKKPDEVPPIDTPEPPIPQPNREPTGPYSPPTFPPEKSVHCAYRFINSLPYGKLGNGVPGGIIAFRLRSCVALQARPEPIMGSHPRVHFINKKTKAQEALR